MILYRYGMDLQIGDHNLNILTWLISYHDVVLIFEHVNERFMDGASLQVTQNFEASNCTSSLARAHSTPIKDLGAKPLPDFCSSVKSGFQEIRWAKRNADFFRCPNGSLMKVGGCFHKSKNARNGFRKTPVESEIKDGDQHFGASAARPFKRVATRSRSNNGNRFVSHDVTLSLNGASFLRGEKAKCNWSFQLNLCTIIVSWIPYLYVIQNDTTMRFAYSSCDIILLG